MASAITGNALPDGGFSGRRNGMYRPDATAWAVMALSAIKFEPSLIQSARLKLADTQLPDGRVPLSKEDPLSFWPTFLSIIAWQDDTFFKGNQTKALQFMYQSSGLHWEKKDTETGHDTQIRGWPWIGDTHSWVEPTSLAVIASIIAGDKTHPRIEEAKNMLLDRQLVSGGWNYGNISVFGTQLRPMPESTGMALSAVTELVEQTSIQKSLAYLEGKILGLATPFSLAWGLLGLSSWGLAPDEKKDLIIRCLEKQNTFGKFSCQHMSVLLLSLMAEKGIIHLFKQYDGSGKE